MADDEIARQLARKEPEGQGKLMAKGLAANMRLSSSVKSCDTRPTSRTITALLAAIGAGFAVFTVMGAPIAVAQVCKPGQQEINGQCTDLQNVDNPPVLPPGTPGKIQCTQHSCVYYRN
jgi:hypothetical protein